LFSALVFLGHLCPPTPALAPSSCPPPPDPFRFFCKPFNKKKKDLERENKQINK
jgi:hypothetical protein